MKNLYLLLFAAILFGCNQPAPVKEVDPRPKAQLELIEQLNEADSVSNAQANDIAKQEMIDSGRVKVSNFILNKLNGRADKWEAIIYSIKDGILGGEIELMFPNGAGYEEGEKYPQFESVVLTNSMLSDEMKGKIKTLAKNDKVLVTGTFDKNIVGDIVFNDFSMSSSATPFGNPEFIFTIDDIKKIEPKQ